MGGFLACLNNGKCLKTGFCDCMAGFSGQICTECELFKFNIRVLKNFFKVRRCNTKTFNCSNNEVCGLNGYCLWNNEHSNMNYSINEHINMSDNVFDEYKEYVELVKKENNINAKNGNRNNWTFLHIGILI
jgi:hypothetical protein